MKENESKDAALDTKDFLTDELKEDMYMELNERYKDLIGNLIQYVADMLKLKKKKKGGITCNGTKLVQFLMLMNVACNCEIKALEKFKREMKRRIKEQLSKVADQDLNRKLS